MRTQKHYFFGIDYTPRKELYVEIDALTEELNNVAERKAELFKKTEEQSATIAAQKRKIDMLTADNQQYAGQNAILERKCAELKRQLESLTKEVEDSQAKYDAAVKYQQNTQAAYDDLSKKYNALTAEQQCNTAKEICPKSEQPRGKDGRFGKKKNNKRADDPRK